MIGLSLSRTLQRGGNRSARSLLLYLIFPRGGLLVFGGKAFCFLLGTVSAGSAGYRFHGAFRWLLIFVFYELILSQGKYLLNDFAGRETDASFLRGDSNRFPSSGAGARVAGVYAALRLGIGLLGLLSAAGPVAALLGLSTIVLQVLYELIKLSPLASRGLWLFLAVSFNYGIRALIGGVAVDPASAHSLSGLLTLLWASCLGALFLSLYWYRQGLHYVYIRGVAPDLLRRYKPGVLAVFALIESQRRFARRILPDLLFALLAVGALPFTLVGAAQPDVWCSLAIVTYGGVLLCLAVAPQLRAPRSTATLAATVTVGALAALTGLYLRTGDLLPFFLLAVAILAARCFRSGVIDSLVGGNGDEAGAALA